MHVAAKRSQFSMYSAHATSKWPTSAADAWSAASSYIADRTGKIFAVDPSDVTTLYNPVEEPVEEPGVERSEARSMK